MTIPIQFEVVGIPKGQPRPKAFARKFANGAVMARVYDPGTAEGWKGQIALAAKEHIPFTPLQGPIRLDIEFRFPRPQDHYRGQSSAAKSTNAPRVLKPDAPHWHTGRPDVDNASKAAMDCLTTLGLWRDDGQVCIHNTIKIYSERPGASFTITPLEVVAVKVKAAKEMELKL